MGGRSDDINYSKILSLTININGYIFAGTEDEGVYRSTDNGDTWTQINNGLPSNGVYSLGSNSDGYIFAGTLNLFRSTNNGDSWVKVGPHLGSNRAVTAMSVNNNVIYAGTYSYGLFRSIDNGDNWTVTNFPGMSYYKCTTIATNFEGNIFAGHEYYYGVLRSTDNGVNWSQLNSGPMESLHVGSLAINSAGDIFAGTDANGVLRSTDNGDTWSVLNSGLEISNENQYVPVLQLNNSDFIFAGTDDGSGVFRSIEPTAYKLNITSENGAVIRNPNKLGFHPGTSVSLTAIPSEGYTFSGWSGDTTSSTNPLLIIMNSNKNITANFLAQSSTFTLTITSSNGTVTKNPDQENYNSGTQVTLTAIPDTGYEFSGWTGDTTSSTNPLVIIMDTNKNITASFSAQPPSTNQWEQTNGLYGGNVASLVANSDNDIFAANDGVVFRTTNNGDNWTQTNLNSNQVVSLAINSNDDIFAILFYSNILFRSTNNIDNWSRIDLPENSYVLSIAANNNGVLFAGANSYYGVGGVYRSTDNGSSWTPIGLSTSSISSIVINGNNEIFAWAIGGILYSSTDNGSNWTQVSSLSNNGISTLVINGNGDFYAGSFGKLHRSTDSGNSWQQMDLSNNSFTSLVINDNGNIFAGTDDGVFLSTNYGDSWVQINDGLTNKNVRSLTINNGYIFAGTQGDGVFRKSSIINSVKDIQEKTPALFLLEQNYPNPFNPNTNIAYSVSRSGKVSIIVYDIIGRAIITLVNEEKSIGSYSIEFDGSHLSSGVYFYQMKVNNYVETKKMILLR